MSKGLTLHANIQASKSRLKKTPSQPKTTPPDDDSKAKENPEAVALLKQFGFMEKRFSLQGKDGVDNPNNEWEDPTPPPTRLPKLNLTSDPAKAKKNPTVPKPKSKEDQQKEAEDAKEMGNLLTRRLSSQRRIYDPGSGSDSDSAFSKLYTASSASFELYAGKEFDREIDSIIAIIKGKSNNSWAPPRDSLVLSARVSHRLYELCRNVVFKLAQDAKAKGRPIHSELDVEHAALLLPATVRNFCGQGAENGETKSSLELAAILLRAIAEKK